MLQMVATILGTGVSLVTLMALGLKWALNGTRKDIKANRADLTYIKFNIEKITDTIYSHGERISRIEGLHDKTTKR